MSNVWNHWQRTTFSRRKKKSGYGQSSDDEDTRYHSEESFSENIEQPYTQQRSAVNRYRKLHTNAKRLKPVNTILDCYVSSNFDTAASQNESELNAPKTCSGEGYAIPIDFCEASFLVDKLPKKKEQTNSGDNKCLDQKSNSTKTNEQSSLWATDLINSICDSNPELTTNQVHQVLSCMINPDAIKMLDDDVVGLANVKKTIRNKIILPLQRPELHKGLYRASSGVLFFGPPGTGKTTLARWIAAQTNAHFFNITPSTLTSKFYGETESLVKALFAVATRLFPTIIFIDEIDSILARRTEKEDESTTRMKNQILQMMDGFGTGNNSQVIVIGATNRPQALDEAALRRLPKRIYIPLPDQASISAQIQRQLRYHAKEMNIAEPEDYGWVDDIAARAKGFNGSDIKSLCTKAAEIVYDSVMTDDLIESGLASDLKFPLPNESDFLEAINLVQASGTKIEDSQFWLQQKQQFESF